MPTWLRPGGFWIGFVESSGCRASGGIADGRGVLAALALGASGAQVGTRFLVARESGTQAAYRERLLAAAETETLVTDVFSGRPARGLRNRFAREYLDAGQRPLPYPLQSLAAGDIYAADRASGDGDYSVLFAGQGLRMLKEGQGAAEIVVELVEEAGAALSRLSGKGAG